MPFGSPQAGKVVNQSPPAGTPAPKGSTVSITVGQPLPTADHDARTTSTTTRQRRSPPTANDARGRQVGGRREEVAQQVVAADREDRLGVELHALDGQLAVAQRP